MRHLEIQNALVRAAGEESDAAAVAAAVLEAWRQMAARLTPVIGEQGVDVLFRRALLVTSRVYRWLATLENDGDAAALQESLRLGLASQEVPVAVETGGALLVNFSELLASLIGETLTERLLEPVWVSATLKAT